MSERDLSAENLSSILDGIDEIKRSVLGIKRRFDELENEVYILHSRFNKFSSNVYSNSHSNYLISEQSAANSISNPDELDY